MKLVTNLKGVPICTFIAVVSLVVFGLYVSKIIKAVPCGKTIISVFNSTFVHLDIYHLFANLLALYSLSRVEESMGMSNFGFLLMFLFAFNCITEVLLYKMFPNLPCSVGLSGILFGIMTWEMVSKQKLDITMFLSIIFMVVWPSLQNSKVSFRSHVSGAVSGIIGGLLWYYIFKNN